MCVKIVSAQNEVAYNMNEPLENQIVGCKQVVVDFRPNDPSLEKFLDEIERFAATGLVLNLNIKVVHHDQIMGAKIKKQVKQLSKDLTVNELMKLMVLTFDNTDRKLEDIANFMLGKASDR